MNFIVDTWKKNRSTFGGGSKEWSHKQMALYYIAISFLCASLALLSSRPSDEFFNATLTAISIVAGFTFNSVIFFVDHKFIVQTDPAVLEQAARQKKVDRLADSSFDIIYYFNAVSILLISGCIIALIGPSIGKGLVDFSSDYRNFITQFLTILEYLGRFLIFLFLLEAIVTFLRALRRLRYLFEKVRKPS